MLQDLEQVVIVIIVITARTYKMLLKILNTIFTAALLGDSTRMIISPFSCEETEPPRHWVTS